MTTPTDIANALGRQEIADTVEVSTSQVSNCLNDGHFPAAWFDALEELGRQKGVEVPRSVFNFKKPKAGEGSEMREDAA